MSAFAAGFVAVVVAETDFASYARGGPSMMGSVAFFASFFGGVGVAWMATECSGRSWLLAALQDRLGESVASS